MPDPIWTHAPRQWWLPPPDDSPVFGSNAPADGGQSSDATDFLPGPREPRHVRDAVVRDVPRDTMPDGTSLGPRAQELADLGHANRDGFWWNPVDDRTWDPDLEDMSRALNAHHTNTHDEMRTALEGEWNWLEGDLRVDDDGVLVMAHDSDMEGAGLTLQEWLAIGDSSERGLKVDVKEIEALPGLLDALERSGIPDGRIMINVYELPHEQVLDMRRRFPDAWLALNPSLNRDGYRDDAIERITALADAAGGRIAFPIRWDEASDDVIAALKPHGKVSIWTAVSYGTPNDRVTEERMLRERGVDGVVDLGDPLSTLERIYKRWLDVWNSDTVLGARQVGEAIVDGAGIALDGVRQGASHLPLVGGLFD